jgi:hypothetical protein
MTHADHVSNFELDLYFAECEPNADLEKHVAACARCAAYLEQLKLLQVADAWPFSSAAGASTGRGSTVVASARAHRASGPRWVLAALAAVSLLAVGYAASRLQEDASYVAVKGSPAVQVLLHRAGRTQPWDGASQVRPGDALALRVACESFVHVSVVTAPSLRQPALARLSDAECPANPALALPFTLLIDGEPGRERFSVVFSQARLNDAQLEAALRSGLRSTEVWVTHFELEKGEAK